MNKQEFLTKLRKSLQGLPQADIEERLTFYREIIEDRMEEGISEEEAVSAAGSVEDIASQVVADIPFARIAKERVKPKRRLNALEIVLLVLGSPIWVSLGIAAVAVIFSVYVSLWSVMISLWSVFASLVGCAFAGIMAGVSFMYLKSILTGVAMLSASMICAGLSIFAFYGCKAATNGIILLTKKFALWIKNCFIKKEEA